VLYPRTIVPYTSNYHTEHRNFITNHVNNHTELANICTRHELGLTTLSDELYVAYSALVLQFVQMGVWLLFATNMAVHEYGMIDGVYSSTVVVLVFGT
jgi:hypothetical protein